MQTESTLCFEMLSQTPLFVNLLTKNAKVNLLVIVFGVLLSIHFT